MTEAANEAEQNGTDEGAQASDDTTDWKAEARKWEARAKADGKAKADLERQRQASMTEAERAISEAEQRGRSAASTEMGQELARTQFDALAARRNADFDTVTALEFVDLKRFLGDDGRPDPKAISAAVLRLVPEGTGRAPSFDGGSRQTAAGKTDMSSLIRKAAGHG